MTPCLPLPCVSTPPCFTCDVDALPQVDDVAFDVEAKVVPKGGDEDVDTGTGDAFAFDAASGAGAGSGGGAPVDMVINIVDTHGLEPTTFKKASLMAYFKAFMARIRTALKEAGDGDRVRPFMDGMKKFATRIVENYKDYDYFVGPSFDLEAGIAILGYREDGITPYLLFLKDGLVLAYGGSGKSLEEANMVPREVCEREGFLFP